MIKIGERIKEIRKLNNLTQTKFAKMIQTTQDSVSLWELGKSYPDIEYVVRICNVFNVSADYLLGIEEI